MILTVRTDKPDAEVGIFDKTTQLDYVVWAAHRQLSETLHTAIQTVLDKHHLRWEDISEILFYSGPGSFTGLRIGAAMVNALAVSNCARIYNSNSANWIDDGLKELIKGKDHGLAEPFYGSEAKTTVQKK